jgi:ATP-dependent DNA helicase RecQ
MDQIRAVVKQYWGYDTLRPLQHEAMTAAVEGRDCLAVMPTGGGKSLCYQAPALLSDKLTVVVSPLIALMKDQVDRLNSRDIPAAFLNSSLDPADKRRVAAGIYNHHYKLVFVAPERLAYEPCYAMFEQAGVGAFAIDEAHCISHWGHDFREDYRRLGELKRRFPDACVHAFTATATPQVRTDIVEQLGLKDPLLLVGDFFRPNLVYAARRRTDAFDDVLGVIREHEGQAGIVYCIRRDDVDTLSRQLKKAGVRAIGYHAGMGDDKRTAAQDAFAAGEVDVVVATVAFGMGIDRSDIRFVVHAAMPKSLEHYQQETGRAGRDGQRADCILFYSGADHLLWKSIIEDSEHADQENKLRMLSEMYHFCAGVGCRHRQLVTYFGQKWDRDTCGACDVCGGSIDVMPDATVIAQKIMSAVARTGERFGAGHVADVLLGEGTEKVLERHHDDLSVFGLLGSSTKPQIMTWIDQLVDQGCLLRDGEYRVLKIMPAGWQVLRSQAEAMLTRSGSGKRKPRTKSKRQKAIDVFGSKGSRTRKRKEEPVTIEPNEELASQPLDLAAHRLYDRLRILRRELAEEDNAPAFMVFSDKTLREIARAAPTTEEQLARVKGVGPRKCEAYGYRILQLIRSAPA